MKASKVLSAAVIFFALGYFFLTIFELLIFKNNVNVVLPDFNYKLVYSAVFGLIGAFSLTLNQEIKWTGIMLLSFTVITAFLLNGLLLKYVLDVSIPNVILTVSPDFKFLFYFSLIPFILITLKGILQLAGFKIFLERIPVIKHHLDLRIAGFIAFLFDLAPVVLLLFTFYFTGFYILTWPPFDVLLIYVSYMFVMEASTASTLGKRLMGLAIVSNDGGIIHIEQTALRNLSRFTLIYWIPMLFGKSGFHELISKTKVVKSV